MQSVYQINDLSAPVLQDGDRSIRLAVIGHPIAHSKSPQMQQAGLDAAQIPHTYIRLLADTAPGAFEHAVQHIRSLGFIGCNITIPFKKNALQLADSADALSRLCGAANTLIFRPDGIHAANTDGPGFAHAIRELSGRHLSELRVLILGACGGAGSALAAQCALSSCPSITLVNRPRPELQQLRESLSHHTQSPIQACTFDSAALHQAAQEADLIVNATSLGLRPGDALPLPASCLRPGHIVYDIVTHSTPFQDLARSAGCTTAHGLGMLLWQGAYAFRHWYGFLPQVELMRQALLSAS